MTDHDIERLISRDSSVRLDRLEKDIWRRESAFFAGHRAVRRLASWQALIIVISTLGSALLGVAAGASLSPPERLADNVKLAPSTLLFGNTQ